MLLKMIKEHKLELHVNPVNKEWSVGVMWEHPPIKQIMAHDNRALIVSVRGSSPEEALKEAETKLKEWLESHKEVL